MSSIIRFASVAITAPLICIGCTSSVCMTLAKPGISGSSMVASAPASILGR